MEEVPGYVVGELWLGVSSELSRLSKRTSENHVPV
jgi:hypothetical protein